jgi:hypothetical protein
MAHKKLFYFQNTKLEALVFGECFWEQINHCLVFDL